MESKNNIQNERVNFDVLFIEGDFIMKGEIFNTALFDRGQKTTRSRSK
jgi:hypothetical protein